MPAGMIATCVAGGSKSSGLSKGFELAADGHTQSPERDLGKGSRGPQPFVFARDLLWKHVLYPVLKILGFTCKEYLFFVVLFCFKDEVLYYESSGKTCISCQA